MMDMMGLATVVMVVAGEDPETGLLQEVDEEESAANEELGEGEVGLPVHLVPKAVVVLVHVGEDVEEAGAHEDSAGEAREQREDP